MGVNYGVMGAFVGTNCNFPGGIDRGGTVCQNFAGGPNVNNPIVPIYSFNHLTKVITYPDPNIIPGCNAQNSGTNFNIPGIFSMMTGGGNTGPNGYEFQVTDISANAGTTSVQTTLSNVNADFAPGTTANLPIAGVPPNQFINMMQDHVRNWQCTNCTGSPDAITMSLPGAQSQPIFTYSKLTYTCKNNLPNVPNSYDINNPPQYKIFGNFVSMTIDVSRADTGTIAPTPFIFHAWNSNDNYPNTNQTTGVTSFSFGDLVNLRIAGTRTITTSGTSGGQIGDSLTAHNAWAAYGPDTVSVHNIGDISAEPADQCPVVSVEIITSRP